ncbi:MAG: hypothetical protein RL376_883 [Verrucomicrobiota bacterium]
MRIALTGGIGCGKSSAGRFFATAGFSVLDVDQIVKERVLTAPEVIDAAVARWGGAVLLADGRLDRGRVAQIVFAQVAERVWWESVVHPRVGQIWRGELAAAPEKQWVVEVPLLFEAGLEKGFDFVVCVGANERTQLNRAVARGLPPAQAEQRIASQLPLATKLQSSHAVLWNEGSPDFLRAQVESLASWLRQPVR